MDDTNQTNNDGNTPPVPGNASGASWWIDDGVAAVGDRPEWFPEKFKSVKAVVQSFNELEKKLGAPPVADYEFGEHAETFDKDHEALKELQAFAKEKRVPQEVFSKMLDSMTKYGQSFVPNPDVEKAKLGDKAEQRIELLNNWAKANLSENAFNALTASMNTADTVLAMEEIRNKMIGNNQIPNGSEQGSSGSTETVEQLQKELAAPGNFQKFKNDENYANDWRRRVAIAARNNPEYVDKQGY